MTKPFDPEHAARHGYTKAEWDEVSDNTEWTEGDFAKAKPFAEAFPDLYTTMPGAVRKDAEAKRRARGPQRAPTKRLVSLRLSPDVIDRFKADGPGWQSRIDETLRKAVGL